MTFAFSSMKEDRCEAALLPPPGARGPVRVVASASLKAIVRRNVADSRERERLRGRLAAAERTVGVRKAQLLDDAPSVAGRKSRRQVVPLSTRPSARVGTRAASPSTSAGGRARSPLPTLRAPSPSALVRPPSPPRVPVRQQSPPSASQSPSPLRRPPGSSRQTSSRGAAAPETSEGVVRAARLGGLRACLLVLLSQRPMSLPALRASVMAVAKKVPGLPTGSSFERAVRGVATFVSPGKYVLNDSLRAEAERIARGDAADGVQGGSRASTSQGGSVSAGSAARPPAARKRAADGAPPSVGGRAKQPRGSGSPLGSSPLQSGSPDGRPSSEEGAVATSRQPSSEEGPAATSRQPSSEEGAVVTSRRPSPTDTPTRRSSGGTPSPEASWIGEVASRKPEAVEPVRSVEEYLALEARFNAKYDRYFSLHRTLEGQRAEAEAWRDALADPGLDAAKREALERRFAAEWARRRARVQRADAAFRVLHAELADAKAKLGAFVEQHKTPTSTPARPASLTAR